MTIKIKKNTKIKTTTKQIMKIYFCNPVIFFLHLCNLYYTCIIFTQDEDEYKHEHENDNEDEAED